MTRDHLIESTILSFLFGAAVFNFCSLLFFFWKQRSAIKKTVNITEYHLDLRAYYKTKMMTRSIMLLAVVFLTLGAIFARFNALMLLLSLFASYFAIKGFSNYFGDFLTYDKIDKIQLCNLYLRSFDLDSTSSGLRIEKSISKHFSEYAHVFSIGNPSTILPSLGTTSIFATDDRWKESVTTLMGRAKMILLRIGQTEGTLWEMGQCLNLGYQYKTIFIINGKQHFRLLTETIDEIGSDISEPLADEMAAVYHDHLTHRWEYLILNDESAVKDLFNRIIASWGYQDEIKEIRHKRLFFWKYLFSKSNFPEKMRPFSFGYFLNSIVYYFYNRWHPATIIYYAVGFITAQYLLRPHLYDGLYVALPAFLIWVSLLAITIGGFIFAPQISWLSKRWPSYEFFKEDNSQLNRILWVYSATVVLYKVCLYYLTKFIVGQPFTIG